MEQQIHFCTTRDGARIAYATVGQGPPLVKAANWLSHLEFDWQSPIWRHLLREFDLAVAYLKKGMNREAVEALEKSANLSNRSSVSIGMLGSAYAIAGSRGEGQAILKELERRFEEKQSPGIYVAVTAAGLGNKDQAFAWLERDFQSRSAVLPFVTHWTWFDSLRDDQRYRNLVQRMGLKP